jgi:hypothetical protein
MQRQGLTCIARPLLLQQPALPLHDPARCTPAAPHQHTQSYAALHLWHCHAARRLQPPLLLVLGLCVV